MGVWLLGHESQCFKPILHFDLNQQERLTYLAHPSCPGPLFVNVTDTESVWSKDVENQGCLVIFFVFIRANIMAAFGQRHI